MPELDPVRQDIEANAAEYLSALDDMIAKAEEFARAAHDAQEAADLMGAEVGRAAGQVQDMTGALGRMDLAANAAASGLGDVRTAAAGLAAANTAAAVTGLGAAAAGAGRQAGVAAGFWARWGAAIHWVVMGTLEIASTAIPALVALGAAIVAMTPAFTFIKDQMNFLVIASGGLHNALLNSVGPVHTLAAGLGTLQRSATPDAFIIFGSAISIATMHTGVFAGMAQQASDVLANFAAKIVTDLQGPAGAALAGFFSNAVKYMIQWGQFLGNLGHAFLNTVNAMWGVGQVLLDVLVLISRALLMITNNPVGAWFIGVAAAMSAVYRYGQLMVTIFNWLGGSAMVRAIKWAVGYAAALASLASTEGVVAAASLAMGDLMTAALGPVGIAIAGIAAVLGIWYLATRNTADATSQLIKRVQSMPATVGNLASGIVSLSHAMVQAGDMASRLATGTAGVAGRFHALNPAILSSAADVKNLSNALAQQEQKLKQLMLALAQLGGTTGQVQAGMAALSYQTSLQDAKVAQLNQAWDQYMSILTGGMGGVASFATSLANIGQVAGSTANNLGTATGSMSLSVGQFAKAMQSGAVKGAGAWTNFSQIVGSTMPQLADWFQTARTSGVLTGQQFSKSILDMASVMVKFAGDSKPAQAELLGFVVRAGLGIKTMPELLKAIRDNGAGMTDLQKKAAGATTGLGNLNQVAKNLSTTLATQETQAIAAAALAASGFTTDVNNMLKAQQTNSTVGGLTWQQWAAKAAGAEQRAASGAQQATDKVYGLGRSVNSLPSFKNIVISVNTAYSQSGVPPGPTGGGPRPHAAAGGFVSGPGTSTSDSIGARLSHGEYVVQAAAVAHYGRQVFDAMNSRRLAGGGSVSPGPSPGPAALIAGAGSGGGPIQMNLSTRTELVVSGQRLGSIQRTESLTYQRRNPQTNLSLLRR